MIHIDTVSKKFENTQVLNNISLDLKQKEQYVIRGASGSGKSTLLYLLGGLDRPSRGRISVDGQELTEMNDEDLAYFRNRYVGFVFQFHFLLSSMNALDNILLPSKIGECYSNKLKDDMIKMAHDLGVGHCLKKYPYELSGGEQQRMNILRALSLRPKLLLCDEPTGNLDSHNSQKVVQLLKQMSKEFGSTLVLVTHDLTVAQSFDHLYTMQDGQLTL